jgi:hypothetical protein
MGSLSLAGVAELEAVGVHLEALDVAGSSLALGQCESSTG